MIRPKKGRWRCFEIEIAKRVLPARESRTKAAEAMERALAGKDD
jgi:hypothetical protein